MHRRVSLLFLVAVSLVVVALFAGACSSAGSARPANIAAPELSATISGGSVFYGSGTSAPVTVDVFITNRATVPIVLRRLEVDSPGMATHGLVRTSRTMRESIAPGETKNVSVFATSVTTVQYPSEPLQIRVIADFENGKDRWREIEM
jgi:hypothetical protein